jgi:uncharacterized membrane protein YhaH (DUF805 family)
VLPPAVQRVWPAMTSQIIIVMLGSAVCGQISTEELSYAANLIQSRNFRAFEAFIVATVIYLALAIAARRAADVGRPALHLRPEAVAMSSPCGTSCATCCWRCAGRWRCR